MYLCYIKEEIELSILYILSFTHFVHFANIYSTNVLHVTKEGLYIEYLIPIPKLSVFMQNYHEEAPSL